MGNGLVCVSGTPDPCCDNPGEDYVCTAMGPAPPTYRCQPVPTCTAYYNQACSSITDCCQTTHPTWTCLGGHCVTAGGTACSGNGCCPGMISYICNAGNCVFDPTGTCDPSVEVFPYTGPVVTFNDLVARIYALLFPIGIMIGVGFIIKAGYILMTSEGNPQKVKDGQEELTAALIGTLFIMLAIALLRVIISSILGVSVGF